MLTTWKRKLGLLAVAIVAVSTLADAQQNIWTVNNENRADITKDKAVARESFPKEFKLFNLNIEPLRQQLFSIVDDNGRHQSTVITLPNADGNIEEFEVFEASNFEPDLQARFPEIRAYSGKGITDRYATLKLSLSPQGIQSMVFRTDTVNEFIEPYSQDHGTYAVFRTVRERGGLPWECSTEDKKLVSDVKAQIPDTVTPDSNTGELKDNAFEAPLKAAATKAAPTIVATPPVRKVATPKAITPTPVVPKAAPAKAATAPKSVVPAKPKAATKPSAPDNLLLLKGVGPKVNTMLGAMGVTSFAQIASWSAADIAEIDPKLGAFAGRIGRDNWVDQARLLAAGDIAGFEKKYGALGSEAKG